MHRLKTKTMPKYCVALPKLKIISHFLFYYPTFLNMHMLCNQKEYFISKTKIQVRLQSKQFLFKVLFQLTGILGLRELSPKQVWLRQRILLP